MINGILTHIVDGPLGWVQIVCCIAWVMVRMRTFHNTGLVGFHIRNGVLYGIAALLALCVAMMAMLRHDWINATLYAWLAASDASKWWDDDENKRGRKKLLEKIKRRIRQSGTGRLGVSET